MKNLPTIVLITGTCCLAAETILIFTDLRKKKAEVKRKTAFYNALRVQLEKQLIELRFEDIVQREFH